jgi:hypothetical protein
MARIAGAFMSPFRREMPRHLAGKPGPPSAKPMSRTPLAGLAAAVLCFGLCHLAAPAAAASAKDCIAFEENDADDALTYRNDCNRPITFYYCVVDPRRTEVAPCRRVIFGTKRVNLQGSRGQLFLTQEMEPRTNYDIKLWGGSKIKWAACDAELGGLESFQPKGNASLDFAYECYE